MIEGFSIDIEQDLRLERREKVRRVGCPVCPAKPGENCFDKYNYPRSSNHQARVRAHALTNGIGIKSGAHALKVDCPVCPAKAGEGCFDDKALLLDARYPRQSNHRARGKRASRLVNHSDVLTTLDGMIRERASHAKLMKALEQGLGLPETWEDLQ